MKSQGEPSKLILVVEDHAISQKVLVAQLKHLGYECITADTGEKAVLLFKEKHFAAVLMDCNLPGIDGFQATEQMREHEMGNGRTPIVAVTAITDASIHERCRQAGMDDFLPKPVRAGELKAMLEKWVEKREESVSP